jgi:PAS domain S-box-containing protein
VPRELADLAGRCHVPIESSSPINPTQSQATRYLIRLLDALPVGVLTLDRNGVILSWNASAARILVGEGNSTDSLVYDLFDEPEVLRTLVKRSLGGENNLPPQVVDRSISGTVQIVEVSVRSMKLEGMTGPIVMMLVDDVTLRVTTERALKRAISDRALLARAGAELSRSPGYKGTLSSLARLLVAHLADWCIISVVDDDGVVRVESASSDPSNRGLLEDVFSSNSAGSPAAAWVIEVIESGEPLLIPEVNEIFPAPTSQDIGGPNVMRELNVSSLMVVPLVAHGETLGALTMASSGGGREYDDEDLEVATELGRRAGVAVHNARLFDEVQESGERYARLAETLQASLLPPELPEIPGIEVAALYRAAARGMLVGGDFYDLFETTDGHWGVVMGDVQGHGARAATITALVRYTLRAIALRLPRPSQVLYQVNKTVLRQHDDERFLSVAFARLKLGSRPEVSICSAGHPLPMLIHKDGSVVSAGGEGMVLGLFPAPDLHENTVSMEPGEALVFFTDGVIEAGAPRNMLGEEGLAQFLARCRGMRAREIVDTLDEMLLAWQGEEGHRDDCALLVVRAT